MDGKPTGDPRSPLRVILAFHASVHEVQVRLHDVETEPDALPLRMGAGFALPEPVEESVAVDLAEAGPVIADPEAHLTISERAESDLHPRSAFHGHCCAYA